VTNGVGNYEDSSSRSASAIYYLKNTVNLTNLKFALGKPAENLMQVGTVGTMRMKIRVCTRLHKANALASCFYRRLFTKQLGLLVYDIGEGPQCFEGDHNNKFVMD